MGVNCSMISNKINNCKEKFRRRREDTNCYNNDWFLQLKYKINNFLHKRHNKSSHKKSDDVVIDINNIKVANGETVVNLNDVKSPDVYSPIYSDSNLSTSYTNPIQSLQKYPLPLSTNSYSAYNYPSINAANAYVCHSPVSRNKTLSSDRSFTYDIQGNKILVTTESSNSESYFNSAPQSKTTLNTTTNTCGIKPSKPKLVITLKNADTNKYKITKEKSCTVKDNDTSVKKDVNEIKEVKLVVGTSPPKVEDKTASEDNVLSSNDEMEDIDLTHPIIEELPQTYVASHTEDMKETPPNCIEKSQNSYILNDFSTTDDDTDNTDDFIHVDYPK